MTIGITALDRPVRSHHHGVDRPDPPCHIVTDIDNFESAFLVGHGQISARKTKRRQGTQRILKPFRPDGHGHIGAIDSIKVQPIAVQPGR